MSDRTSKDPAIIARCKLRDAAFAAGRQREYFVAVKMVRTKGESLTVEKCRKIWSEIGLGAK